MLDKLLKEARRVGEGKSDEVSSLAMEALEHMQNMMGRLIRHHEYVLLLALHMLGSHDSLRLGVLQHVEGV